MEYASQAQQLVDNYPEEAVDILVRCCQEHPETCKYIVTSLQLKTMRNGAVSKTNILHTLESPPSTTPFDSHQSGSPTDRQRRLSHRTPSTPGPVPSLSPSTTVSSSSKSHASKDGSEYLLILTLADGDVAEKLVRMRNAQIAYSLIREELIRKSFSSSAEVKPIPGGGTLLPCPGFSVGSATVPVSFFTTLTWRRPKSNKTHETTFYLVSGDSLNIDILLGYQDSGEDVQLAMSPQPQRMAQGFRVEEFIRPAAPTPPTASYHRSSVYESHASTTPMPPHNIVQAFLDRQHGAAIGGPVLPQNSPATTQILGSSSSHGDRPSSRHSPADTSSTASSFTQTNSVNRIRLNCVWGTTTTNVWLDLTATSEAFFIAVQPLLKKQKGIFDRADLRVLLKANKEDPATEKYLVCLDEEALEADWEETVKWVREHGREKAPHLFGSVEIEGG